MALPTASDNVFPKIIISEAAAPASPSAGQFKLFVDSSDHLLKYKNSSGTVVTLGAGLADPMTTRGDIIVRNASNVTARLGVGGAGTVLSSDGTDVSWQAGGGGGSGGLSDVLEQHTASSSATLDFTSFISSTYDHYVFELVGVIPATSNVDFLMRMGTGGGPTWDTGANYGWAFFRHAPAGSAVAGASSGQSEINLLGNGGQTNSSTKTLDGHFDLFSPQSTAVHKSIVGAVGYYDNSTTTLAVEGHGIYLSTTAVTGIRFYYASGNIASGTIRVKGYTK